MFPIRQPSPIRPRVSLIRLMLPGLLAFSLLLAAPAIATPQELAQAVAQGDLEQAESLLDQGENASGRTSDGRPLLALAAARGDVPMIYMLADYEATIDDARGTGLPALHIAARHGQTGAVAALLDLGAKPDLVSPAGTTALWEAVSRRNPVIVKLLLQHKADVHGKALRLSSSVRPLLIEASATGSLESVKALVAAGADKQQIASGWTPIMHAAANGHTEIVAYFLSLGISPNAASPSGWTPALAAAAGGKLKVLELLGSKGADLKGRAGWRAMQEALYTIQNVGWNERTAIARFLLKQGAVYDAKALKVPGTTELGAACASGVSEWARAVLARGANPNVQDATGWTPLMYAVIHQDEPLVKDLLAKGAKVGTRSPKDGQTALSLAVRPNGAAIFERLIAAGADLDTRDAEGQTLLWNALMKPELIAELVEQGIDLEAADHQGRTALLYAVESSFFEAVEALLEAGADPTAQDDQGRDALALAGENDLLVALIGPYLDQETAESAYEALGMDGPDQTLETFRQTKLKNKRYKRPIEMDFRGGKSDFDSGNLSSAKIFFESILLQQPDHTEARQMLGWTHLLMWEFNQARQQAEFLLEADPESLPARALLAHARLFSGDSETALADYEELVELEAGESLSEELDLLQVHGLEHDVLETVWEML